MKRKKQIEKARKTCEKLWETCSELSLETLLVCMCGGFLTEHALGSLARAATQIRQEYPTEITIGQGYDDSIKPT